jgi:hypothetical protein
VCDSIVFLIPIHGRAFGVLTGLNAVGTLKITVDERSFQMCTLIAREPTIGNASVELARMATSDKLTRFTMTYE